MSFNRPSDGQFNGRNARSSEPYYPQIYDQSNRQGSQHSPTRTVNNTVPFAQTQRETAPVEKFRAAATAAAAANAGSSSTRPPSYPGLMSENPTGGKQQQQSRGYRRNTSESEDEEEVEPPSRASMQPSTGPGLSTTANKSLPVAPSRSGALPQARGGSRSAAQASSSPTKAQAETGNSIQRPASTTIMSSVLKPLSSKIQEYSDQMAEAEDMMEELDAEMEKLKARRKEAEARFTAAKTKHDDYQRQYQGVERAMRGEPDMQFTRLSIESSRPTTQQTVQTPIHADHHSRNQSWSSQATNQYAKNGSKSRLSKIFGL